MLLHSATQFHPFSTLPWDDQYPASNRHTLPWDMWRIKTTKDAVWPGGWIGGRRHSVALPYVTKGGVWLGKATKDGVWLGGRIGGRGHSVALPYVVQHTLRLPYIGKVPVQGRTTKDGVWLGPRVASGSERVASVLKNFRNYVANKDHQGWRLARSLDITLGYPIPPFLYPSLG